MRTTTVTCVTEYDANGIRTGACSLNIGLTKAGRLVNADLLGSVPEDLIPPYKVYDADVDDSKPEQYIELRLPGVASYLVFSSAWNRAMKRLGISGRLYDPSDTEGLAAVGLSR